MKARVVKVVQEPLRECPWCRKKSPFPGTWRNGTKERGRVIYVCGDCADNEKGERDDKE